jgi:hypothetical protein
MTDKQNSRIEALKKMEFVENLKVIKEDEYSGKVDIRIKRKFRSNMKVNLATQIKYLDGASFQDFIYVVTVYY